jgi:DNA repair protein SbcD/Mre11
VPCSHRRKPALTAPDGADESIRNGASTFVKLLCIADIHLGRQASRVPAPVLERFGARELGPAGAWARAVEFAVAQAVDAVLLAGDVVEQEDDFHEAYPDLRRGVERLADAGIRVLGVTGNHDVKVLPRLTAAVPAFELLGAGGSWQAEVIEGGDGSRVRVLGWSFPEPKVRTSPLAAGLPERDALPTIGLLHCDRDQLGSHYAPVRSAELRAAPVDAWLLGHIHKPDDLSAARPSGYLGSLTGMDPGESGAHGPWLLEVAGNGHITMAQVPLAPMRWTELEVPVDGLETAENVHRLIAEAIEACHAELGAAAQRPDAVGCRLHFTGRSDLRAAIERSLHADDPRTGVHERDGIVYFVHDWRLDVLPAIDLAAAAEGTDPVALLARRLIVLRGEDADARQALIAQARERMIALPRQRPYNALGTEPPDDERIAATLEAAATRALDALLQQQEPQA